MSTEFRINKEYAEKYNKWRQKEELQKCNAFSYQFYTSFMTYECQITLRLRSN